MTSYEVINWRFSLTINQPGRRMTIQGKDVCCGVLEKAGVSGSPSGLLNNGYFAID